MMEAAAGAISPQAPGDLEVTSITLGGSDPGEFSIDGFSGPAPPFTLVPGASNQVTVSFNPTSAGVKTADLIITSNDPVAVKPAGPGTQLLVPLQGMAVPVDGIPTLSNKGILFLALLLLGMGAMLVRRL